MTNWPHDPTGPRKPADAPSGPVPENGRVPAIMDQLAEIRGQLRDLYTQGGRAEGALDRLGMEIEQQGDRVSRLQCSVHVEKIAQLSTRVERLEVPAGPRTTKPSEGSEPVRQRDLARVEENTGRIVVSEIKRVDEALVRRVSEQVAAAIKEQRDEERAADERARAERRAIAADEATAKDLALSQSVARWKAAGAVLVAVVGAAGGAGFCQLRERQQQDTAALTRAVEHRPPPVVVQVPTPMPVPTAKEE